MKVPAMIPCTLILVSIFHADGFAFQNIHQGKYHATTTKKIVLPRTFGITDNFRIPSMRYTRIRLNQNNADKELCNDDVSIEELYRRAKEEDEEWYNTFVRDVLGDDRSKQIGNKVDTEYQAQEGSTNDPALETKSKKDITSQRNADSSEQSLEPVISKERDKIFEAPEDGDENESRGMPESMKNEEERRWQIDTGTVSKSEPTADGSDGEREDQSRKRLEEKKTPVKDVNNDPGEDAVIQFMDMYDNPQRFPFSRISKLGYEMSDVAKLQSSVLELIIEDNIPLPEDGLPRRWIIPEGEKREVKVLKRKSKDPASLRSETDGRYVKEPTYESSRTTGRKTPRNRRGEEFGARRKSRSVSSDDEPIRRRSRRRRPEPYSPYKRAIRESEDSDSLWMDIPTFKQYLRREADFRLMVLGPDWEGWVKGESDWRLNLYKKWLNFVENGVGDDIFEELAYAPPSERERKRRQPPPSSSRRLRKPRRNQEEEPRNRRGRQSPSERSQQRRPPPYRKEMVDDEDWPTVPYRNRRESAVERKRSEGRSENDFEGSEKEYSESSPRSNRRRRGSAVSSGDDDPGMPNREGSRRRNPKIALDDYPNGNARSRRRGDIRSIREESDYDPREYQRRRSRRSQSRNGEE